VLAEKILSGLSPNFRIHVSVSDLYIQRIGPHIFLQQNIGRATKNLEIGLRSRNSFSGNICFEFLVFCSVQPLTAAIPYFKIATFIVQILQSYIVSFGKQRNGTQNAKLFNYTEYALLNIRGFKIFSDQNLHFLLVGGFFPPTACVGASNSMKMW
jgi:hypothetical protein